MVAENDECVSDESVYFNGPSQHSCQHFNNWGLKAFVCVFNVRRWIIVTLANKKRMGWQKEMGREKVKQRGMARENKRARDGECRNYQGFSSSRVSTVVKSSMHSCSRTVVCWWGTSTLASLTYLCWTQTQIQIQIDHSDTMKMAMPLLELFMKKCTLRHKYLIYIQTHMFTDLLKVFA